MTKNLLLLTCATSALGLWAGVSQAANDAGAASGQVLDASGQLSRQAEELAKEMGTFITGVRAA